MKKERRATWPTSGPAVKSWFRIQRKPEGEGGGVAGAGEGKGFLIRSAMNEVKMIGETGGEEESSWPREISISRTWAQKKVPTSTGPQTGGGEKLFGQWGKKH